MSVDVGSRLEALRKKMPKKTETVLDKKIREFLAIPCDLEQWDDARNLMRNIREECVRVHARDVWLAPPVADALEDRVKAFYGLRLKKSLEQCFDLLERHVENKLMVRGWVYSGGDTFNKEYKDVSIAEFDAGFESGVGLLSDAYVKMPYTCDGVVYTVQVVERGGGSEYYAADATHEEISPCSRPPLVKRLSLKEYLDLCVYRRKVHRRDSLYEAIFDTLEEHIKVLDGEMNDYEHLTFKEVLRERLHW